MIVRALPVGHSSTRRFPRSVFLNYFFPRLTRPSTSRQRARWPKSPGTVPHNESKRHPAHPPNTTLAKFFTSLVRSDPVRPFTAPVVVVVVAVATTTAATTTTAHHRRRRRRCSASTPLSAISTTAARSFSSLLRKFELCSQSRAIC